MKKLSVLTVALVGAAAITRAQTASTPQSTPAAGQSGFSPSTANGSGMQLSTGTVTDYVAGQRIAVRVSEGNEVKLDLNKDVRVDGLVAPGVLASVMWMSDGGGNRRVTSITAAPGPGDLGTANLESGYQHMSDPARARISVTPGKVTPRPAAATPRATATPSARRATPTPVP
jgi:hypothetical protein